MIAERSGRRAHDLDADRPRAEQDLLLRALVRGRLRDLALQRPEALAQAPAIEHEAAQHVPERAGTREAAAEPDRAEAPAATEPEAPVAAVRLERRLPEQGGRHVHGEQPLEDRGRLVLALEAVDVPRDDLVREPVRELDGRQLVGQVRLVGGRQRLDQRPEVGALVIGERVVQRCVDHLPDAAPVAVEVVVEGPERPRPAADEPAEDDAAADVPVAPPPLLERAELLAPLRRQQTLRDLLGEEALEEPRAELELVLAARRVLPRLLLQPLGRLRPLQLLREDRLVGGEQLLQRELEVLVAELLVELLVADVLRFASGLVPAGSLPRTCHDDTPLP